MNDALRLHFAPDNASLIVRLVLEELGQPYETVLIDRAARAQDTAAYRAINPAGLIPALETPQGPIFETAAILLWLADQHGRLAPRPDSPQRGRFLSWLFFTSNTLHADLRVLFYPDRYAADAGALHKRLRIHLALLDAEAANGPDWLSPDAPSVLTWYLACLLRWMALYPKAGNRDWFALADTPQLQRILVALEARPPTRAAITAEGLGPRPFTAPVHPTPPEGSAT